MKERSVSLMAAVCRCMALRKAILLGQPSLQKWRWAAVSLCLEKISCVDSYSKAYSLCSFEWSSDLRIKTTAAWSWLFHHHIIQHSFFIVREVLDSNLRPFDFPVRCCMHFLVAPLIINLGTGRKWMLNFKLGPLYPKGKNLCYPLNRLLVGPESVWTLWRREEMLVSGWKSNPGLFSP